MAHEAEIYPHHDLFNLAYYHLQVIEQKQHAETPDSIALDCMSCLLALGLTVEALINFSGEAVVPSWDERDKYHVKLRKVCENLGYKFNESEEPFKTLKELKMIRDRMAHAKPIKREREIASLAEIDQLLANEWDPYLTPEQVTSIYEQVDAFEKMIYRNPAIQENGILTCASGWSGDLKP
ncbi:hypothetical protein [Kangiella sediminilitoris]|uniref:HEPN AbiU2-like domain-containing protein n=1 Tax=Kangiella sediminilitoris TaxID=1144748 RepID=A0A1B3BA78_9GAMM|nr:hypothetical protein [Kangiella sediminilitoris]AOE49654.1 hypothetical protein KS2013_932 [Kangiella sediminilitoris]